MSSSSRFGLDGGGLASAEALVRARGAPVDRASMSKTSSKSLSGHIHSSPSESPSPD